MRRLRTQKRFLSVSVLFLVLILAAGGATSFLFASCGPFTDVGSLICPFVLELYYSGIAAGTSSTTFSPGSNVTRGQMAVFIAAGLDLSLAKSGRRAALDQWWTTAPHYDAGLGLVSVGPGPQLLKGDGDHIWVADSGDGSVYRIRSSDGVLLGNWTGASGAYGVLVAMGRVFVTGNTGNVYMINPASTGSVTTLMNLGSPTYGITFDGTSLWTASSGGVSSLTPGSTPGSWAVATYTTGFSSPFGALFDGTSVWVTDAGSNELLKLNSDGTIALVVPVGSGPGHPAFDGRNIWVPGDADSSLTVVRPSDGLVLQTFSATNGNPNGLSNPIQAAFDGQRVAVTNSTGSVSLFKASDLSPIGFAPLPGMTTPTGVASDGVNFWISDSGSSSIGRF